MALSGSCSTSTWTGDTTTGKLVFNWTATQNKSNNTSTISWNIKASVTYGWIIYSELRVKIDGVQVYYRNSDNHTQCSNGTQLASGTKTLTHNSNGARSFTVEIGAGIYYSGINETGSGSFTLDPHTVYSLYVSAGTGSTISVNRTSSGYASTGSISNGAKLYYGDKLTISFSASNGYGLSKHTVNGSSFTSGGTYTVGGNVSVVSEALAKYTLSISAGTGSTISVSRTSSGVGGTGSLSNGAIIYKNDKLKITFTPNTNYEIQTHTVNGTSFTSGNTHTVSGNVSVVSTARVLASGVGATNADIESVSTITVNKYNNSYVHSLQYSFGNLSGYITSSGGTSSSEVKFGNTSVAFTVPSTFYAQIPNSKTGTCTITCKTYQSSSSNTQLGSSTTCTFIATASKSRCKPTISASVKDVNNIALSLTDDENYLIRYRSDAECAMTATAKNSATIVSRTINGVTPVLSGGKYKTTEYGVQNTSFVFTTTDSRGYTNSKTINPSIVSYVPLTCNPTIVRSAQTGDSFDVYLTGNYYRGAFGEHTQNTLEIKYQYKESTSSSWSALTAITTGITYGSSTYSVSFSIALQDQLAYKKAYDIRIFVRDGHTTVNNADAYLTTITKNITMPKATPVFDWGQSDFKVNVDMAVDADLDVVGSVSASEINASNDIKVNGTSIAIKRKEISLSNVNITTQSSSGAYYNTGYSPSDYNINGSIISLLITSWGGAAASFVPYYQNSLIRFISDISQTVTTIKLLVTYI